VKRYIIFLIGITVSGFLIFYGVKLGDFVEVIRNAALLCLSCVGIAN